MEFRHSSWLTAPVYQHLERSNIALCLPISPTVPIDMRLTTHWTYLRFHQGKYGIAYDHSELINWAKQIQSFLDQKIDVYAYFNNDAEGYAIQNANELKQWMESYCDRLRTR